MFPQAMGVAIQVGGQLLPESPTVLFFRVLVQRIRDEPFEPGASVYANQRRWSLPHESLQGDVHLLNAKFLYTVIWDQGAVIWVQP